MPAACAEIWDENQSTRLRMGQELLRAWPVLNSALIIANVFIISFH